MSQEGGNDGRDAGDKTDNIDWAWKHCVAASANKQKVTCNYCGKTLGGGGITRFKHHVAGGDKNVKMCKKVPNDIQDAFKTMIAAKKAKTAEKRRDDRDFNTAILGGDILHDSDDDDFDYPEGYDANPNLRRAYRRMIRESRQAAWDQEETERIRRGFGPSQYDVGQGSGAGHARARHSVSVDVDDDDIMVMGSSKRKTSGRADSMLRSASLRLSAGSGHVGIKDSDASQKNLKGMWGGWKAKLGSAIGSFFFAHGIPAHAASEPYLQRVVDVAAKAGTGVQAPTAHELMTKYLPEAKEELTSWLKEIKKDWPEYGATLMCDGWSSGNRRQIINFLAYSNKCTMFLDSVDASVHVKDHNYIMKLMEKYVKEVGIKNVIQVVTDNGANFKKAGECLMKKYPLFWTPCAAHCIDLILKDFANTDTFERVIEQGRVVTNFIYNHSYILNLMRTKNFCGGDLVRPAVTRFATNFLALQSLQTKKPGLKALFCSAEWYRYKESRTQQGRQVEQIINSIHFWDEIARILHIMEPVVKVLRLVDGDKSASLPWIYEAMRLMEERVKREARHGGKQYLSIIKNRWHGMLCHPLHKAAHYLNPQYQYKQQLGMKAEFLKAIQEVVDKLLPDPAEKTTAMNEVKVFRDALGSFGTPIAINSRDNTEPGEWWALYGYSAGPLRLLAVRILSQTASAGGCERNWSTFNLIHSKRRNRLGAQRLNDLVFVHYNLRLKQKKLMSPKDIPRDPYLDPIDIAYTFAAPGTNDVDSDEVDPLRLWMDDIGGDPVLDAPEGRPDAVIAETFGVSPETFAREEGTGIPRSLADVDEPMTQPRRATTSHTSPISGSGRTTTSPSHSKGDDDDDDDDDNDDDGGDDDYVPSTYQDAPCSPMHDDNRDYLHEPRAQLAPPDIPASSQRQDKTYARRPRGPTPRDDDEISTHATGGGYPSMGYGPWYDNISQYSVSDLSESVGNWSLNDLPDSMYGSGNYLPSQHDQMSMASYETWDNLSRISGPRHEPSQSQSVNYVPVHSRDHGIGDLGSLFDTCGLPMHLPDSSQGSHPVLLGYNPQEAIHRGYTITHTYYPLSNEDMERLYPRMGLMMELTQPEFHHWVHEYETRYRHTHGSWMAFCQYINNQILTGARPPEYRN